jgi:hypothetical protein
MKTIVSTAHAIEQIRAGFRSEPGFGPGGHVALDIIDRTLVIEGEVASVAVKKRLLRRAAAHPAAVRIALEKDPFVNASQVRVTTRNAIVTLEGIVPKEGECEMAEFDAWYVFGVDRVENRIEVRPIEATGAR